MNALDIIKWEVNEDTLAYRFPTDEIRYGSQLIVYPGQTAFFVSGGSVIAEFTSGTYTLKSNNIPFVGKVVNIPFNSETPFKAEVWFVNQISLLNNKWGTITPLQVEDPKYGVIVSLGAYGQYGIKVENPRMLIEKLVGNMSSFSRQSVVDYFKGMLVTKLTSIIYKKLKADNESVLNINAGIEELSDFAKEELKDDFANYGLSLEMFYIISAAVKEDDPSFIKLKEAKDARANIEIMGRDNYQMSRSFDVLDKAASNGNGMAGAAVGLGAGFGLGNQAAILAAQTINTNPTSPTPTSPSGGGMPPILQKDYFLIINDKQEGPFTKDAVEQKFQNGEIDGETYVWTKGWSNWQLLSESRDFSHLPFTSCPPPIPTSK